MAVCDQNAITETGRKLGVLESGYFKAGAFVHGRLRVGEAMSPPLIKKVRSFANQNKISIIDAPPGTSCPVIAALKDTDFVVLVTEPTPFGLHDLKLAAEAVKLLGIPCGLVINRSDVGNDDVKGYARAEKLPVLMEIPFDRSIAETYSRGQLVIEMMPVLRKKFLALRSQIDRLIG